jgi:hypothetical protein
MARAVHRPLAMAFRCPALLALIAPFLNVSLAACNGGDSTAPIDSPERPGPSEVAESGAHAVGSPRGPSFSSDAASPSPAPAPAASGSPLATRPAGEDASSSSASPEASLPYDGLLGIGCTGASPAFATDIVPILRGCAAGEICHGNQFGYGGLVNATTQRDTSCTPARVLVTPRDLGNSYMLNKLLGIDMCTMSSRMPLGGVYLLQTEIQTFADWVCVGAPDD